MNHRYSRVGYGIPFFMGVVGVVGGGGACDAASAPPRYRAEVLPSPEPGTEYSQPIALSNDGRILGMARRESGTPGQYYGWLWDGHSTPTWLAPPAGMTGDVDMTLRRVNSSGAVVGGAHQLGTDHGFATVWRAGQAETLQPYVPNEHATGWDINEAGDVVGNGWSGGMVWRGGVASQLQPAVGDIFAFGAAINNTGMIAGSTSAPGVSRPARWVNGVANPLQIPADMGEYWPSTTWVETLNDAGAVIAATSYFNGETGFARGFVWFDDAPVDLGVIPDPADPLPSVWPRAVNSAGWILAQQSSASWFAAGLLWIDGVGYNVADLIDGPAIEFYQFLDMNDSGQILASVTDGSQSYAVLLTPIPAPGAASVPAVALVLAARRRRR